jgi:uncharacterized protein with GYD domain
MISACVLIRTEHGKWGEVVEKIKQFREAKKIFTVMGRYDVVVDLEAASFARLGKVVLKLGNLGGVVFTESLVELVSGEG